MATSDLLEINKISLKAELKCALTTNGVLYATTGGTTKMLLSLATNLDFQVCIYRYLNQHYTIKSFDLQMVSHTTQPSLAKV